MRALAVSPVQFESRDGHLQARYQLDEQGREALHIYDHQGHLLDVLDVLHLREPAAAATGSVQQEAHGDGPPL